MRHHSNVNETYFRVLPETFNKNSKREVLQYCLGATLYMPGTKVIIEKIIKKEMFDLTSMVMCFEDAIQKESVEEAEKNVLWHLNELANALEENLIELDDIPLIFLRVRNTEQFKQFADKLTSKHCSVLSGFVFPKFYSDNAKIYIDKLLEINNKFGQRLFGMPILEGMTIAFRESRNDELLAMKLILDNYKDIILNIRVGGTDFSSLFGVRRGINHSIYDILVVRDCLSDILNFFGRNNDGYTISAPVWEYFLAYKRDDINQLVEHDIHKSLLMKNPILNDAIDGLLREVLIDKANGFVGKTIIHPSHTRFVNAMQAVTWEEYEDASQILSSNGGVVKSNKANKMNEINPHTNWAQKIVLRAKAYGVIEDESHYLRLI